jgi:hypothetical protein
MPTAVEMIMWTAVPNGISISQNGGAQLDISVHVAPTLSGGATGTLSDFSDFQNWPTVIGQEGHFHVEFTNGAKASLGAAIVPIDQTVLNNSLWTALFSPPAGIEYSARDAGEPYTKVPVVSYPASLVAGFLQSTYTNLTVNSPKSYPSLGSLLQLYGDLAYVNRDDIDVLQRMWSDLSQQRLSPPVTTGAGLPRYANDFTGADPATALAALRFYHMAAGPGLTHSLPTVTLPVVDFHRALSFIGEHRALQRALGLVFDITVPVPTALGSAVTSDFYVQLFASNVDGSPFRTASSVTYTPVTPRTQCDASTSVFEAHASTSQLVGRQLTLGDTSSFSVYEIDVDGGGLKTAQFADNLKLGQEPQSGDPRSAHGSATDTPTGYAPPSLRSAGLTVAAVNRGLTFVGRLNRSASLLAGLPSSVPDLTAEDLVRGFVLDVYDSDGKAWNSTARRDVTYAATGVNPSLQTSDEASTDAPPRMQSDPTNPAQQQLNLPENLIRWNGWSNAAPRPGVPLQDDGSAGSPTDPGPFSQLTITVNPTAGSLPRLRFGTAYALRARVVDIAGNVIPLSAGAQIGDGAGRVSTLTDFGRHEPIGSPDIYNWKAQLPGESLKRLVIRDLDAAAGSVRGFAPNRIAESFAELHGGFDIPVTGGTTLGESFYPTIVAQESARYSAGAITFTSPVPYLPDPLSRGGVLFVVDGPLAGNLVPFDFHPASGQSWPRYQPFGLALLPGSAQATSVDATKRQVTFSLTKADTVNVQLSSTLDAGDLSKLGMYRWVSEFYGGAVPAGFQQDTITGLHWSMTPFTNLQLVYAVQKPLLLPSIKSSALRELGWTYAELFGDLFYSPKSTSKTDLLANWGEPVDNGPGSGAPQGPGAPNTALSAKQSTVFPIPGSQTQEAATEQRFLGRHEFFDTKHRVVSYTAKATSRFTEHYQGTAPINVPSPGTPVALALPGFGGLGLEPGSVVVTGSDGTTIYQENTAFTINPAAGTITFLAPPAGPPTGSAVIVDFLPPVSVDSAAPDTLNILSTARPLSPNIVAIVPIFEWHPVRKHGSTVTSGRTAAGLRILLSRPWWSSGIGELLGVVTWPDAEHEGTKTIPKESSPYVTDWGADPVFRSRELPTAHPRLASFPSRVHSQKNLTIDERAGVKVNVAGHAVKYDPVRDLWYCDVHVNAGRSYTPMIRLALARYQPDSVGDAQLSRIVLADVMTLDPGRAVTIVRKSPTLLASVTLSGYSYSEAGDDSDVPGFAEVIVERRVPEIHDPEVGWDQVGPSIPMTHANLIGGLTRWEAREIKIPAHGTHRLFVSQYEIIDVDKRTRGFYAAKIPARNYRMVYQDLIPL